MGPSPPPYGGVSIYIRTLFESLKNHDAELWTFGDQEVSGPNVYYMKDKRVQLVPLLLKRGLRVRMVDCTHFLVEYPSSLVPIWINLKRLLGFEWIKVIQDGSLPSRYDSFSAPRKKLFQMATASVTEFIVVSHELEQWLRTVIGVSQKISVIKNLFPVAYSESQMALPADIQAAIGPYLERTHRVCSIGIFIPDYGFKHVAEAVEKIRDETKKDIGLLLLDGDFGKDEEYRRTVLTGREWITVLKNVDHPKVFQLLKQSDVFARGSGFEGYGLSRVEAIWCGLPVVATRAGETRGMLLYDFGNVGQLASQLERALSQDNASDVLGWAKHYREEARNNLQALVSKLGCGQDYRHSQKSASFP